MAIKRKYKWDYYRQLVRVIPNFSLVKDEEILQNGDSIHFEIGRRRRSHQVSIRERLTKS